MLNPSNFVVAGLCEYVDVAHNYTHDMLPVIVFLVREKARMEPTGIQPSTLKRKIMIVIDVSLFIFTKTYYQCLIITVIVIVTNKYSYHFKLGNLFIINTHC